MAKNQILHNMVEETILWHDRKRILGMPISFTVYDVDQNNLTIRKGLFSTTTDEMLLYRILDLKMKQTLGQKIFGVGTLTLYTADQSNPTVQLENIKYPDKVRRFLGNLIEQQRNAKGITGREMYGAAGIGHDNCDHDGDGTIDIDLNGDGIPD